MSMTDTQLTDAQRETLERAKERTGYTPAPWECENPRNVTTRDGETETHIDAIMHAPFDFVAIAVSPDGCAFIAVEPANLSLITDAPALQDLALAQDAIITAQAARIKELEDEIAKVKLLREQYAARVMKHLLANPPKLGKD